MGLLASAIFAVYLEGDHYGFVCFDDCVVERVWDENTVRFLKNIANIISTVLARQNSADRLAQNQKTYEAVLNNVDSFIFVVQPESHKIIFANRYFKNVFGDNCVGKRAEEYIALRPSSSGAGNGPDYPEFYCGRSKQWLAVNTEEITWVDGNPAVLVNCYDITAGKLFATTLEEKIEERTRELKLMTEEAESAKQRAEDATLAKSQFLANMSHEIRTPMNAILGLSELLAEAEGLNRSQMEHVRNIRRSSTILLNIINDILDISKLEAGRLTLVNVNYSLMQTIDHVASLLRGMAESKGLECRITDAAELDVCLYGDDIRLRQVLINILGNAVKFTEEGFVEMAVELTDSSVIFKISDSGNGIRPEDLELIFEPFSQSDIHRNRKIQGTGLGLPICKSLIELMNGSIKVHSVYGKGSIFTITIPRVPGDESRLEREAAPKERIYAPEASVLVVDDIEVNLYVAEALLEEYGIKTVLASSGAEAIKLVQEMDFDIVFMDHMMPDMNGIEATLAIRALGGKYETLPIIALTANVVNEARSLFGNAGMDDFLPKPLEASKLNSILEKWIPSGKIVNR